MWRGNETNISFLGCPLHKPKKDVCYKMATVDDEGCPVFSHSTFWPCVHHHCLRESTYALEIAIGNQEIHESKHGIGLFRSLCIQYRKSKCVFGTNSISTFKKTFRRSESAFLGFSVFCIDREKFWSDNQTKKETECIYVSLSSSALSTYVQGTVLTSTVLAVTEQMLVAVR